MRVGIIGVGRLGICLALEIGKKYETVGIDLSEDYVQKLNDRTFESPEPGVTEGLKDTAVEFTTDKTMFDTLDIALICVRTDSLESGSYDHQTVDKVCGELRDAGTKNVVIVSTVIPGHCEELQEEYPELNIAYSPEFIAQGSIIKDIKNPPMILVGAEDNEVRDLTLEIFSSIADNEPQQMAMTPTEAEITKVGVNCFLTSRIAMANNIGDLVKTMDGDPDVVLKAIGLDSRIGHKYISYGYGFGGPCLPRDNRAFIYAAHKVGTPRSLNKAIDKSNEEHLIFQLLDTAMSTPEDRRQIVTDDIYYKEGTDIIEESQKLKLLGKLSQIGFDITIVCDKKTQQEIMEKFENKFKFTDIPAS